MMIALVFFFCVMRSRVDFFFFWGFDQFQIINSYVCSPHTYPLNSVCMHAQFLHLHFNICVTPRSFSISSVKTCFLFFVLFKSQNNKQYNVRIKTKCVRCSQLLLFSTFSMCTLCNVWEQNPAMKSSTFHLNCCSLRRNEHSAVSLFAN